MQVRATRPGVYGSLREQGAVFDIVDDAHLGSWMEPVEEADRKRLAVRIQHLTKHVRPPARPGVPPTSGPGYPGGLRDPVQPKAPEKPESKKPEPKDPPKG